MANVQLAMDNLQQTNKMIIPGTFAEENQLTINNNKQLARKYIKPEKFANCRLPIVYWLVATRL